MNLNDKNRFVEVIVQPLVVHRQVRERGMELGSKMSKVERATVKIPPPREISVTKRTLD